MAGRPSALEDPYYAGRIEEFLTAVGERGMSAVGACGLAGIGQRTLYQWLEKADEEEAAEHYVRFAQRFAHARAARELMHVDAIREARLPAGEGVGPVDWRARAWLLERQEPAHYGPRQHIETESTVTVKALEITGVPLPEQD